MRPFSVKKPIIIIEVWLGHFPSTFVFKFLEMDGSWRFHVYYTRSTKRPLFQLLGNSVREHVATLDIFFFSIHLCLSSSHYRSLFFSHTCPFSLFISLALSSFAFFDSAGASFLRPPLNRQ